MEIIPSFPRKREPSGFAFKGCKSLGSRFRGNDGRQRGKGGQVFDPAEAAA